jgi:hypothetical protein
MVDSLSSIRTDLQTRTSCAARATDSSINSELASIKTTQACSSASHWHYAAHLPQNHPRWSRNRCPRSTYIPALPPTRGQPQRALCFVSYDFTLLQRFPRHFHQKQAHTHQCGRGHQGHAECIGRIDEASRRTASSDSPSRSSRTCAARAWSPTP